METSQEVGNSAAYDGTQLTSFSFLRGVLPTLLLGSRLGDVGVRSLRVESEADITHIDLEYLIRLPSRVGRVKIMQSFCKRWE